MTARSSQDTVPSHGLVLLYLERLAWHWGKGIEHYISMPEENKQQKDVKVAQSGCFQKLVR